jgi:hypothetical protein
MPRWALLLLLVVSLLAGPGGRCAVGAGVVTVQAGHQSFCDPHPPGHHNTESLPCAAMACCVLFAPAMTGVTVSPALPAHHTAASDAVAPETRSVRPPTPPPRIA